MKPSIKYGFVAAMKREIDPLIAGWNHTKVSGDSGQWDVFTSRDAVLIIAGIGKARARRATKVLVETYSPDLVTSIGFAGSLVSDRRIGDIVVPARIICAGKRVEFRTAFGNGTLVTSETVAGVELKSRLRELFQAEIVDMEAVGAAAECSANGRKFLAVKVISDDSTQGLDFVVPFVTSEGFRVGGFLAHVGLRPWLWPAVMKLQKHSAQATARLCEAVRELLNSPEAFESRYAQAASIKGNR